MKKKVAALLAVLAGTAGAFQMGYLRVTGSVTCALVCSGGEVIVDSGQLTKGDYAVGIWISTNAANTNVQIQHRNAANNGNVKAFDIYIPTNSFTPLPETLWTITEDNQRIRVVLGGPLTIGTKLSGVLTW